MPFLEKREVFEMKRKRHYDEGANMKLAKQLLKEEEQEDMDDDQA